MGFNLMVFFLSDVESYHVCPFGAGSSDAYDSLDYCSGAYISLP
jgi:hypothetical protein